MITAALDRELAAALGALIADGKLPEDAAGVSAAGTWRRAADASPAAYATPLPFRLAGLADSTPAALAAELAGRLRLLPWLTAVDPAGGYLTLTITWQKLARSAALMAAAGPASAGSTILAGTTTCPAAWPELATASTWLGAWQAQAAAMTGQLALAAGARSAQCDDRERSGALPVPASGQGYPLAEIVAYRGADLVRYRLARTRPGRVSQTAAQLAALLPQPGRSAASVAGTRRPRQPDWPGPPLPDPLAAVREGHLAAASVSRWAADLRLPGPEVTSALGDLLAHPAERELLTLLSFLPVTVAAAARRRRPDELPRYLETLSLAWLSCRLLAPAVPFGGRGSAGNRDLTSARLILADAVCAVLTVGLALTGVGA